ncbi:MAG: Hsp20/alpha crystallin family protein [SAR324 cluster bacterium]|nr:Hsp20/alpha crystallin family protein [SAR324 cluster bacterium]MBF0352754.1 Hsp20/alpha crystallin family protein [SAR324 cluster bacterium]
MWNNSLSRTVNAMLSLQDALDRAHANDFFGGHTTSRGVNPPVNLFEKDGDVVLVTELPGVHKENIKMEVKENMIRLSGERKLDYSENCSCHRMERGAWKFDRSIKLPFRVDNDKIRAELKNGLLVVSLPRAEQDKPRQIAIN